MCLWVCARERKRERERERGACVYVSSCARVCVLRVCVRVCVWCVSKDLKVKEQRQGKFLMHMYVKEKLGGGSREKELRERIRDRLLRARERTTER